MENIQEPYKIRNSKAIIVYQNWEVDSEKGVYNSHLVNANDFNPFLNHFQDREDRVFISEHSTNQYQKAEAYVNRITKNYNKMKKLINNLDKGYITYHHMEYECMKI